MAIGVHFPPGSADALAQVWQNRGLRTLLGIGAALALLSPLDVLERLPTVRWFVTQMMVIIPSLTGYGLGSPVPQVAWLVLAYWWAVSPWAAVEMYRVSSRSDRDKSRRLGMGGFRFWLGTLISAFCVALIMAGMAYIALMHSFNFPEEISVSRWRLALLGWLPAFAYSLFFWGNTDLTLKTLAIIRQRCGRTPELHGEITHG